MGVAVRHFGMPEQKTKSHWRRQLSASASRCCRSISGLWWQNSSPLHLMDDVLGQAMIFLQPAADCLPGVADVPRKLA